MIKFNQLKPEMAQTNEVLGFVGLVTKTEIRPMKTGKDFLSLELTSKEGIVNAKKWTVTKADQTLKVGQVVEGTAKVDEYQGTLSLNIQDMNVVDIDPAEFKLTAIENVHNLTNELKGYVENIQNDSIKNIVVDALTKAGEKFYIHPAAKAMHHNEEHGLLYHTTRMIRAAVALVPVYDNEPERPINKDLIVAGIIFHDIGKLEELEQIATGAGEYTKASLIGHICLGYKAICGYEKDGMIDEETAFQLSHVVLSHHGKQEYGSPVTPAFREAFIVNTVDGLDAKMMAAETEMLRLQEDELGKNTNLCVGGHVFKNKIIK